MIDVLDEFFTHQLETTYVRKLREAAKTATIVLNKNGVNIEAFTDTLEVPHSIRPPSQSNGNFQMQQAHGDWAEVSFKAGIERDEAKFKAVHYGDNSKMRAEDEGFSDAYKKSCARTYVEGKRPDLLFLDDHVEAPDDCTNLSDAETQRIVAASFGGLEIRSSRFEVQKNKEYKKEQLASKTKTKPASIELNFTTKVEDMLRVYVWCVRNKKPQAYAQVFYDEVYGLSFLDILKYITTTPKLNVETPKRSGKPTIGIPISQGILIGKVTMVPDYEVVDNITNNGRHDTFAAPKGGRIEIDVEAVRSLLS